MKKIYTTPKIETTKINSKDPTAAFVSSNINVNAISVKPDSSAANTINY
ncbi:MAG: hypothetical protein LUC97_01795 [Clostridiales bacterium]|nr:hypothetical protein [Clostridiales bacterium]